jgi:hypothetical protein
MNVQIVAHQLHLDGIKGEWRIENGEGKIKFSILNSPFSIPLRNHPIL